MGFLSLFRSNKPAPPPAPALALPIDLGSFKCGQTVLGTKPGEAEPFANSFNRDCFSDFRGIQIETTDDGLLNSIYIELKDFPGEFLHNGSNVPISLQTTPEEIISRFGPPYWTDTMDEEMIFFYEYQSGGIELQFEFPDRKHLGIITLMKNGILSGEHERKAYGVTREWPPR